MTFGREEQNQLPSQAMMKWFHKKGTRQTLCYLGSLTWQAERFEEGEKLKQRGGRGKCQKDDSELCTCYHVRRYFASPGKALWFYNGTWIGLISLTT